MSNSFISPTSPSASALPSVATSRGDAALINHLSVAETETETEALPASFEQELAAIENSLVCARGDVYHATFLRNGEVLHHINVLVVGVVTRDEDGARNKNVLPSHLNEAALSSLSLTGAGEVAMPQSDKGEDCDDGTREQILFRVCDEVGMALPTLSDDLQADLRYLYRMPRSEFLGTFSASQTIGSLTCAEMDIQQVYSIKDGASDADGQSDGYDIVSHLSGEVHCYIAYGGEGQSAALKRARHQVACLQLGMALLGKPSALCPMTVAHKKEMANWDRMALALFREQD